jgi:predicted permease
VRYPENDQIHTFVDSLVRDLRALPGVRSVGVTSLVPFSDDNNSSAIEIVGRDLGPGGLPPVPTWTNVDGDYFEAMGIPLLRGRFVDERDTPDSEKSVVIDRRLADKHWPNEDPIGQQIRGGLPPLNKDNPAYTIVGVVGEILLHDVTEASPVGIIYFPHRQMPRRDLGLTIKTAAGADIGAAITDAIQRLDPELPFYDVRTMNQRLEDSLESRKALVWLSSLFGGLALLLAGVGIYGVLAYAVSQRTKEIGIRMALGAEPGVLVRSVAAQGLRLAAVGLAVGIVTALLLTRLMESVLFHVTPSDPLVLGAVSAALMSVALLASLIPSLRATRINPNQALRND